MRCYKVSGDPNEALKYLSPCESKTVEGFSQLYIESLVVKSSKYVHIYHLREILSIPLPLSKYHFQIKFSPLYGLFKAKTINLNLKLNKPLCPAYAINLISMSLNTSIATND